MSAIFGYKKMKGLAINTITTPVTLLYVQTVVSSVPLKTHYMEAQIMRYCERTSDNTAQFQDSMKCVELQIIGRCQNDATSIETE